MLSMFIGKPISAVAGLALLVMLSRYLSPAEYGGYFAVLAIAEIFILASNLGLMPAATRYLGAHELVTGELQPYGPVRAFIVLRIISLALFGMFLLQFSAFFVGFVVDPKLIPLLFLLLFGEGLARFVEIVLDSMFCQGRSQASLILRTLIRLSGVVYLISYGDIDLRGVVVVEAVASAVGALFSLLLLSDIYVRRKPPLSEHEEYAPPALSRILKFAMPAFVAQILGIAYGADVMKLILANKAGESVLAAFGFAYSIVAVIQRYMPATLFVGVFRPIFVSVSNRLGGEKLLSDLVNVCIKINWFLLFLAGVFVYVAGDTVLIYVSKGNYPDSGSTLFVLILALSAIAVHLTLSLYTLAIERSMAPLYATAVSVVSLPLGFVLADTLGAEGIAVALLVGEIVWCFSCFFFLQRLTRARLQPDWRRLSLLVGCFFVSSIGGQILSSLLSIHIFIPAFLACCVFLILCFIVKIVTHQEVQWIRSVLPVRKFLPWGKV